MLPKANRLSSKEFDLVVKTGREICSPLFTIKYILSGVFKFSSAAPKKTFKTAVSRNRTRRIVYDAMRGILSLKEIKPSYIVLIVKKDIKDIDSQHLVRTLQDLFVQARLIA
jgi:ribonuclease P protein component